MIMMLHRHREMKEDTARRCCAFYGLTRNGLALLTLCSLIMLMFGCSTPGTIKQYVRPNIDMSTIKTIAVLPLINYTGDDFAGEKVRSKINIELLSRGIEIIEPGEIVTVLRELKVRSMDSLRQDDIVNIGNMLNADVVITGSVETFGMSKGISVSYPEVSVQMMMFDTADGKIIWSVWHTSGGASFWTRHFGAEGNTLDNVSERVIKEAFDALY